MKNNLIMTAIYAFSATCLSFCWVRYHDDWSTFREVLHFLVMVSFYLAAVVSAFMAGWDRRRRIKRENQHED